MKDLNEAIAHCYEVANEVSCETCKADHLQLAWWLEELREFRSRCVYEELE